MLFRAQQELDRLPYNPALRLQRRDSRIREIGVLAMRARLPRLLRLQAVQASQRLVNKRDTVARRLEEQLIVIAMQLSIK
jgi:hypothetical protein